MRSRSHLVAATGGRRVIPPGPTASFTKSASSGDTSTSFAFTDTSTGTPTSWLWNFGDGQTSTAQNPSHTYALAGSYTVTLTATNAGGSSQATSGVTVTSFLAAQTGYDSEWDATFAYTDTGRTTLAAANGDLVAALGDQGSNGRHASQSTSGNRPTFLTVGGKPAVKFLQSASKTLATSSFFDSSWNTAYTCYLVMEYHGRGGPRVHVGGNSTNNFIAGTIDAGNGLQFDWFTGGNGSRLHTYTGKNRLVACLTYDGTTKRVVVRGYSGVTDDDVSSAMTATLGMTGGMTFGDLSQGGGFASNFLLHHCALFKAGHNSTVRGNILTHLAARWLTEPAAGTRAAGAGTRRLVADGDSLTVGQGVAAGSDWVSQLAADLGGSYSMSNLAVGGQMQSEMNADAETEVDVLFSASNTDNIYVNWAGTNDLFYGMDAAGTYRRIREGCLRRRAKGFKVVVCNTIDRNDGGGTFDTRRAALNTLLLNNYAGFADAHVDLYALLPDATVAADFQGDQIHITAAGQTKVKNAVKTAVQSIAA